jgi:2,4-dienoyl-CoA reductase-like NADH-dependent reductase (Old Yellow Enzyme family)
MMFPDRRDHPMDHLFSSFALRGLSLANRIVMSPMCMYAAGEDGRATDWHLVHYGARAMGRCGLILTEATAIEPRGRISGNDLGLWADEQIEPLAGIVRFCHGEGVAIGVQLAHAGRKAFSAEKGHTVVRTVAPSPLPFAADWVTPLELSAEEIEEIVAAWRAAARRAREAGFDLIEIHGAHGYLLHQFLSPLSNRREDEYGGALANRARLHLRVARAVREVWPADRPLILRVSASDWIAGGTTPEEIVSLCPSLREAGIDLLDCSSGGALPVPPSAASLVPGYQVPFAEQIRREGGIPTAAVGLITKPEHADEVIREGKADLVAMGREFLRDPQWPLRAAAALGKEIGWPRAYERGRW